jgi:protein arginine N-methyltransferase 7
VAIEDLLERALDNPVALGHLASVLFNMGQKERAGEIARKALAVAPEDAEVLSLISEVLRSEVPHWHFKIVRDTVRNAAYDAALRRAVTPRTKVFEIGAGTGILAMMAARAGAHTVVTCETVAAIAAAARDIAALNGLSDRIRVLAKTSFDVDPDADMAGPADLLVSEIVSNMLLDQGVLPAIEHAAKTLLKPDARVIPARGVIRVALAHDAEFDRARLGCIDGFDLSPFNRLAPPFYLIARGDPRLTLRSEPADLFDFDFQSGGPFPSGSTTRILNSAGGEANGIAQWIALQMDERGWYENRPAPGSSSAWAVMFWPFRNSHIHPAGTALAVRGRHDRRNLRIWA